MNALVLIGAFLLAAGLTFATNWLALIPWWRSKGQHWSEQARLVYPVLVAARSNLWTVPAALTLALLLYRRESSPLWVFTGMVSVLGVYAGNFSLDREVFPRISTRELLRQILFGCVTRFLFWFVFLGAAVAMPDELNLLGWSIADGVILLLLLWLHGGLRWTGRIMGLFEPAPERLRHIVAETSARMNIPFRDILQG